MVDRTGIEESFENIDPEAETEVKLLPTYKTIVGRTKEDLEKLGAKAAGYIGKHIVGKGEDAHLTTKVLIDLLRPHIMLICGKRGCLTEDTKIFTDKGFIPISKFDTTKHKIWSYNKDTKKFEWKNSKLVKYDIDNENLIRIEFSNGQTITATSEHPLLVSDGRSVIWKKACELTENDSVVSITEVPEVRNDKESERIARLLGFILANGNLSIRKGKFKDGRGYWYNGTIHRLRIFNDCDVVLQQAKKDLEEEFGLSIARYKRNDCNCEVVETKQSNVVKKFIELGIPFGNKSKIIKVPEIVWESSNNFKANFLKALFSCGGYVNKSGTVIEYYSNSKKFLDDLHLLLMHFKIRSKVRTKKVRCNGKRFTSYALSIYDYASTENFKKIGFFDKTKNERLEKRKFRRVIRRKKTKYLDENLFCLKIKNISKVNGIKQVYDLYVPSTHSFIANGVISHNTGKSYSAGVITEEIALLPEEYRNSLAVVIIDTMGIFWSLKNSNDQQLDMLREWKLEPKGLKNVKVFVPFSQIEDFKNAGIPVDTGITIPAHEFKGDEWRLAFNLSPTEAIGVALEKNVNELIETKEKFTIEDLITKIRDDRETSDEAKDALENMLMVANQWGVFGTEGIDIDDLIQPGQISIVDVSRLRATEAWSVRNLLVAILARKIYQARVLARKEEEVAKMEGREAKKTYPMVWLIIDEAHNFVGTEPSVSQGPLLTIAKQGREPGISLVVLTQMPAKIHQDVLSQCDLVISHRLTSKDDLNALHSVYQVYMAEEIEKFINKLPRWLGSAIILDDNLEKVFSVQIRPRLTHHAGGTAAVV